MKNKRDVDKVIIKKILKYCNICKDLINEFDATFDIYCNVFSFQLSTNMCLVQIGELSSHLSDEFKTKYPAIPWREIKGMRNVQVHDYESLDYADAWHTITKDIPQLKAELQKIITEEFKDEGE